jgi:hypothetical protein
MKRISVKLLGSTIEPFALFVHPGVSAGEILAAVNLTDYVLAVPPAPNRYFLSAEAVYDELLEGDFLLAVAKRTPSTDPDEGYSEREECIEEDKPTIAIDIEKARQDLMSLLEGAPEDDDPAFLYDWIMPT